MKRFFVPMIAASALLMTCRPGFSQPSLRSVTITAGFGAGLGAGVRADLGEVATNLSFMTAVDYWRWSSNWGNYGDVYDLHYQRFAIQPTVMYRFPLSSSKIVPFAEGGLSIGYLSLSDQIAGVGGLTTGIYLAGGVDVPISPKMDIGGAICMDQGDFAVGPRLTFKLGD